MRKLFTIILLFSLTINAHASFPVTGVLDSFTRANSSTTLGSNWNTSTNATWGNDLLGISSNSAYDPSGADGGSSIWNVASYSGTVEEYFTVNHAGSPTLTCMTNAGTSYNGYMLVIHPTTTWTLYKMSSSTQTSIKQFTGQTAWSVGDSIGMSFNSSTGLFTFYHEISGTWSTIGTYTDTTYACSYIGIGFQGGGETYQNFGGGSESVVANSGFTQFLK